MKESLHHRPYTGSGGRVPPLAPWGAHAPPRVVFGALAEDRHVMPFAAVSNEGVSPPQAWCSAPLPPNSTLQPASQFLPDISARTTYHSPQSRIGIPRPRTAVWGENRDRRSGIVTARTRRNAVAISRLLWTAAGTAAFATEPATTQPKAGDPAPSRPEIGMQRSENGDRS